MAKNQTSARRARTSRKLADDTKVCHDLMGARAAVLTAILAMDGRGVHGEIAISLRIHVLAALERIEQAVTGEVRP